ncbi:hypothetical protein [Asticcacaulis excentricus]|uniref:Uncharacterized protein n=1 Tax=Asticcacaulis excentricus (strain ATCC 15261 / DSM 4724 / KCTC 12464 / NCIMB 9791 / VKM B-1370 / CB 48) TaxID=573065 RepID=E8RQZ1_ASTEC|nr:hypothetical protein [Asticcacaulis excentricus]ADU12254.1 hypothetical protein Astex_0566 [Asticcacaulis excentricus CB 48]
MPYVHEKFKLTCGTWLVIFALSGSAQAQTATAFNLTCKSQSSHLEGTNSFGTLLKTEDYQGIIDETVELAVDLKGGTSCHPRFYKPEEFGEPTPIISVSAKEIVVGDIAAREVESNDYSVMSYQASYQIASQTIPIVYGFFDDAKTTQKGSITLTISCVKSTYKLG